MKVHVIKEFVGQVESFPRKAVLGNISDQDYRALKAGDPIDLDDETASKLLKRPEFAMTDIIDDAVEDKEEINGDS